MSQHNKMYKGILNLKDSEIKQGAGNWKFNCFNKIAIRFKCQIAVHRASENNYFIIIRCCSKILPGRYSLGPLPIFPNEFRNFPVMSNLIIIPSDPLI